jgi:serine protease Do
MRDLLEYGRVRRPLLGISIKDIGQEDAEVFGLPEIAGVLIEDFGDGSPAERAGIQRGDVIVAIDRVKVERVGQLQRLIAQHKPGDVVHLQVVRFGAPLEFRIRLNEAPIASPSVEQRNVRATGAGRLGIQVGELTPALARELGFRNSGGAVITAVASSGAAFRKGVIQGTRISGINRKQIRSAQEAQSVLRRLRSRQIVSLLLEGPDGRTQIANIRVP